MNKDPLEIVKECSDIIFDANNELMAIVELLNVEEAQGLNLSEWGRAGLAAILDRITVKLSEAYCDLPTFFEKKEPREEE